MVPEQRGTPNSRSSRFEYVHDTHKWPPGVVDVHHVLVPTRKTALKIPALWVSLLTLSWVSFTCTCYSLSSVAILLYLIVVGVVMLKLLQMAMVVKETVIIIPAFGVQLETHYRSGRIVRRFVPCNNILKPVLNECVTPVTCYWSLALILRDEDELVLVFKGLHPPLKILLSIWKALCVATDGDDSIDKKPDSLK